MEEDFRKYLKRGSRSDSAIKRILAYVESFRSFLVENRSSDLNTIDEEDLEAFVAEIEGDSNISAKSHLWGLIYYFDFINNQGLKSLASTLREQRIERRPFPIRKFRGLNPEVINQLERIGIKHVKQVLTAGTTPEDRLALADRAGVTADEVLEIVKLADLARIPGMKGIRTRLYYDAGVDTLEKLAAWEPDPLREMLVQFVKRSGFDGIPPLPAEIKYSISKAKELPRLVKIRSFRNT